MQWNACPNNHKLSHMMIKNCKLLVILMVVGVVGISGCATTETTRYAAQVNADYSLIEQDVVVHATITLSNK